MTKYEDRNEVKHYLYRTWALIKHRCYAKNNNRYYVYGARGISIYEPWLNDYLAFKKYILSELGERPSGYSLDRIDNNGNYEPGNLPKCRKNAPTKHFVSGGMNCDQHQHRYVIIF